MKALINLFCLPAIIILLLNIPAPAQIDNNIIGRWESVNRSNTGIGSSYVFYPNGRFDFITGAMIDYIYHLNGDRLITTFVNAFTKQVTKDTSLVEIKGDSLFQRKENDRENTYIRVNPRTNDKTSIIGTWELKNEAGQTGYYNFAEDGILYFRLPFETRKGNFTANKNKISFTSSEQKLTENYRVKNGFLTIFDDKGSEESYHKVK